MAEKRVKGQGGIFWLKALRCLCEFCYVRSRKLIRIIISLFVFAAFANLTTENLEALQWTGYFKPTAHFRMSFCVSA